MEKEKISKEIQKKKDIKNWLPITLEQLLCAIVDLHLSLKLHCESFLSIIYPI